MILSLDDFDRLKLLDGPSLRREISRIRESSRNGYVGKLIADDSWRDWRAAAGVDKGAIFISQYQALIVCYHGFYSFSGKLNNNGRVLKSVVIEDLPALVEAWLPMIKHPRIIGILEFIQRVGLTVEQLEMNRLKVFRNTGEMPTQSQIFQNRARRCLANRTRPQHQRFIREVVCKVVLKPAK